MSNDQQRRFECASPHVIFEKFDDETLVINLEIGVYYSLRGSAENIWVLAGEGFTGDEIVHALAVHYGESPADVAPAVRGFLSALHDEGLLRARGDEIEVRGAESFLKPVSGPGFPEPQLGRIEDMADMLLLDPVHEADAEVGWPTPAGAATDGHAKVAYIEDDDVSAWPDATGSKK